MTHSFKLNPFNNHIIICLLIAGLIVLLFQLIFDLYLLERVRILSSKRHKPCGQ